MLKTFAILMMLSFWSCLTFAKSYKVHKNLDYVNTSAKDYDVVYHKLDVYAPKGRKSTGKVLIFIHGGSWDTGHKETYKLLGRAFAANGIVTVIINYRLSPAAKYEGIAYDCARAVSWVKEHISEYGGNPNEIFVSGHSAGGHLAALIANDETYFSKAGIVNPIKGVILNDPFGLNIFKYLEHGYNGDASFRVTFTNTPSVWKKGSPVFYIKKSSINYFMLYGGSTYPAIITDSQDFHAKNIEVGNSSELYKIGHKKHIGMVLLFFRRHQKQVKKVVEFMKR
jgi:acetyl esterase/lipase